jgi:hypothetical protein
MKIIFVLFSFLTFNGMINSEAQNFITIERDSFSVKYPANWTIDKKDKDYDPDALFSIDSPEEGATIMFMIFTMPIDADLMLDEQVKAMKSGLIKKPTAIKDFDTWGKYKGKGKIIEGKILGIFKGYVKLFMYNDGSKSMLVMEQLYDNDAEKFSAGMKAIVDSFTFK